MKKNSKVIIVGDISIDTHIEVDDLPLRFQEVSFYPNNLMDYIGGSGGNITFSLSRLNEKTELISPIGDDTYGKDIIKKLKQMNISSKAIYKDYKKTRRSVILSNSQKGVRQVLADPREDMTYTMEEEKYKDILKSAKFAHFVPVNWSRELINEAKKYGYPISVDLHLGIDLHGYHYDFIKNADIVFFSGYGMKERDIEDLLRKILIIGPETVICTKGAEGSYILQRGKNRVKHFNALNVFSNFSDTIGASDSFIAGFISSYVNGYDTSQSMFRASIAANYACTKRGSSLDTIELDYLNEVYENLIKDNGIKYNY